MPLHCLARIRPLHKATGTRIDIHVSSASLRQITGLNGVVWEPAMVAAPVLNMRLFNGDFQAAVEPGSASLPINMTALKQSYPTADACAWSAAPVDIWAGEAGQAWPWTQVFSGKVSGWNRRGQVLSLSAETAFDDKNVLTGTYAGTGGAEGSLDLKGKVKPLALGWPQNVEPVLINAVDSVYQFSAYGPIEAVTKLYERGSDFGASIGDYANYTALVAASIPPGRWATCLAQGMIRLGAPAFGVITGDLKGHKVGASAPRLTGAIINALATISGTSSAFIESASLTALDAAAPYPVSAMITDQVKFSDAAKGLALPCNWQAGISLLGKFFVMPVTLAGSPALTLDSRGRSLPQVIESAEQDVSPPYFKTILGAAQSWRVHTADEISFTASLILRGEYVPGKAYREGHIVTSADGSAWLYVNPVASSGNAPPSWPTTSNAYWENHTPPLSSAALKYGDGTPIESLKPAQVGATVGAISGVNLRNNADTAYLGDLDIITAAGTAAAIAGQGPGATAVAGAVMNYAVGLGQNALTNSAFENGSYGWEPGWDNYASFTPEHGVGLPGYSGALSTAYTRVLGTPPAGVFDSYNPSGGNPKRWWLPVSGGDRVFASALVAYHRLAYAPDLKVGWYDASGAYLTESVAASGGRNNGANGGEPGSFDRVGGFLLAPANARYARIWIRGATDGGQTDPYLFYTQMMLCRVPADQTAWPVYHDGGADLFANVTGENTAAAIAGQGPLATAPSASPYVNANISIGANGALIGAGGGSVTIGGLGYLGDLDATRGARVGLNLRNSADTAYLGDADVITAAGTAAAIAGQGALATQSSLAYGGAYLTGFGGLAGLASVNFGSSTLLETSGGAQATLGNFKTALGTAAAFTGQGALATANSASWASQITGRPNALTDLAIVDGDSRLKPWYVYDPTSSAYLHTRWPAEFGANVTESRTAAAIAGQGALATLNTVGSSQLAISFGANVAPACNPAWAPPESFFTAGWNPDGITGINAVASAQKGTFGYEWSLDPDLSSWAIFQPNNQTGSWGISDYHFKFLTDPSNISNFAQTLPVTPGQRVEFSIYAGNHRSGSSRVGLVFYDGSGNMIGEVGETNSIVNGEASGGNYLSGYKRIYARATAPSNAALFLPFVRKGHTVSGQSDSWLFLAKPMICFVPDAQTALTPWSPGGNTGIPVYSTGATMNALRPAEFGANITESRTAAAIAGQGYFATQNYAGASRLLVSGYDNIIPDGDYRDPSWWGFSGLPNVGFLAMDSYWEQNRSISFTCDRDFDFSSAYFNIEPGATYRVRTRIWNNDAGAGWTGNFWALIHMPNVAWWSLKHGTSVNADVGGSANAIAAIGDTGVQEFYFRATSNTMRNIQFRFKSTARGSRVDLQVMISKVPQLGKDLIKSGTATKYLVSEIETGLGTAAAIAGQGAGATANNLAQLDATAAAQLTTAYNGGVQSAAYGETIKRKIGSGGTLALSALVNCAAGGVSGSIRARIESRPYGGSWSTVVTGAGSATGPGEPGGDSTSGTFTNSTGVEQVFEFRVIEVRTPSGAGGAILASQSYVTG